MGQAKRKQYSREQFLREHPFCAYCGDVATTTDHNPPRCFFDRREWPEGYEFPACHACNQQSRLDEQALAVLNRLRLVDESPEAVEEWTQLFAAVRNNQPDLLAEWGGVSATSAKKYFRETFGSAGDTLRHAGWGALNLGPLSRSILDRFCVKLGQALYYLHNRQIFEGDIYFRQIDTFKKDISPDFLERVFAIAPILAAPQRNTKSLAERFIYKFNHSPEHGAMYAVVRFGDQLVFQIMAVNLAMAQRLRQKRAASGEPMPERGVVRCIRTVR